MLESVTTDTCSTMRAAARATELQVHHIPCFDHELQVNMFYLFVAVILVLNEESKCYLFHSFSISLETVSARGESLS